MIPLAEVTSIDDRLDEIAVEMQNLENVIVSENGAKSAEALAQYTILVHESVRLHDHLIKLFADAETPLSKILTKILHR